MGSCTAFLLVGQEHPNHGGLNPEVVLALSENSRMAWTAVKMNPQIMPEVQIPEGSLIPEGPDSRYIITDALLRFCPHVFEQADKLTDLRKRLEANAPNSLASHSWDFSLLPPTAEKTRALLEEARTLVESSKTSAKLVLILLEGGTRDSLLDNWLRLKARKETCFSGGVSGGDREESVEKASKLFHFSLASKITKDQSIDDFLGLSTRFEKHGARGGWFLQEWAKKLLVAAKGEWNWKEFIENFDQNGSDVLECSRGLKITKKNERYEFLVPIVRSEERRYDESPDEEVFKNAYEALCAKVESLDIGAVTTLVEDLDRLEKTDDGKRFSGVWLGSDTDSYSDFDDELHIRAYTGYDYFFFAMPVSIVVEGIDRANALIKALATMKDDLVQLPG